MGIDAGNEGVRVRGGGGLEFFCIEIPTLPANLNLKQNPLKKNFPSLKKKNFPVLKGKTRRAG